ncbi:aluminum-activated malate transporter 12 [Phtheirospermum japonicum]|uniref:Aluminum-activated malate transporter 12 n=1 Tax=Phtheirospermum japonicum TaxID=374723 RepID=A0A830DA57_9LAMI|nr:aluminum-activated malate transporter 12 [Phtheirospermum japonicum]
MLTHQILPPQPRAILFPLQLYSIRILSFYNDNRAFSGGVYLVSEIGVLRDEDLDGEEREDAGVEEWGEWVFRAVVDVAGDVVARAVRTAATYVRFIPYIKKNYDYGVVIFLVTFNLITVSSYRVRNDLHDSIVSKLEGLAYFIKACVNEYFNTKDTKTAEDKSSDDLQGYKAVLDSKSTDETLPSGDHIASGRLYSLWAAGYVLRGVIHVDGARRNMTRIVTNATKKIGASRIGGTDLIRVINDLNNFEKLCNNLIDLQKTPGDLLDPANPNPAKAEDGPGIGPPMPKLDRS